MWFGIGPQFGNEHVWNVEANETIKSNAPLKQSNMFRFHHTSRKTVFVSDVASRYRLPSLLILTFVFSIFVHANPADASPIDGEAYVTFEKAKDCFVLSASGISAPLVASSEDFPGVIRALKDLQKDIGRVSSTEPDLFIEKVPAAKEMVLVGTLGKSPIIDRLVKDRKIDASDVAGRWEIYLIQAVENPLPGVDRALVITGSDKRGTIYGLYDLSARIGVSPWTWWADVPVRKQKGLYVSPGRHKSGEPAVKYRGIFINDEAPALSGWVFEKFGGFNHQFYEKVFELILRLKGNTLWPAMWGRAFNADDPLNPQLADEYGVVMGTSHHEPMMRAQQEWKMFGSGQWNYESNEATLKEFWRQGIRNMDSHESIVTIGMRGDGDLPMSEKSNIALLERIVRDQREILAEVTGKDPSTIPQIWALYKEVQEYYDKGMRVPEDVTLLLCDDNWGNIRKLPKPGDKPRSGGYGIYYHFDFVGGPRNYKWLNTNPIPRIWDQMHLAYEYGVNRIWIVNVGDIKPMELPISFFLDYAWDPDKWPADRLPEYVRLWAEQQFGGKYAEDIADVLTKYTQFNGRRKPELLAPDTYSLVNYREAETVVSGYNELAKKADRIDQSLPPECRDAYYQLVLFPVKACANLNDLHVTVGQNRLYAKAGRASTHDLAEKARRLFAEDAELSRYYNTVLAGGKWSHMADQTHISYTNWQQPEKDVMPEVKELRLPDTRDMGVSIEGSDSWWPMEKTEAVLPELDAYRRPSRYIEVFNRGQVPFDFTAQTGAPWLRIAPDKGKIEKEQRLWVDVDWKKAPIGEQRIPITITGPNGNRVVVQSLVRNPSFPKRDQVKGFVEGDGVVSIEAEHFTRMLETQPVQWVRISDLGRTLSAMTPFPVTAPSRTPGDGSPCLEYSMFLFDGGDVKVHAYLSPTQNYQSSQGLRYAISFDNGPIQMVNIHANDTIPDWKYPQAWNLAVSNNIKETVSRHHIDKPGDHVLKFWMIDPGIVLQKLVVDAGGMKPSYLGPPESFYQSGKNVK